MSEANVFTLLKIPAELHKLMPLRVIYKKDEDGNYLGYCENSFSMSWEKSRIHIAWSGRTGSNLGISFDLDATKTKAPSEDSFVIDPLSEDCPFDIDWNAWLTATGKYDSRNAPFKVKELA